MPERSYPSRRKINERVGQASQWESRLLGAEYGCVPMTVAFTHGYSTAEQENGLVFSPSIEGVTDGAQFVAKLNGQELVQKKTVIKDLSVLKEDLSTLLQEADSCWIAYFTGQKENRLIGHMIGVIPTAPGEYSRWHSSSTDKRIAKLGIDELTQEIMDDYHAKIPDMYIFGFYSK